MALKTAFITIVGCGPGAPDYLIPAGRQAIEQARVLVGAKRLLETFGLPGQACIEVGSDIQGALEAIAATCDQGGVVVLVSGDPGIASLARPVLARFGHGTCKIIPGISSIQTAFARLGLEWLDARIINAHGRMPAPASAELIQADKIALLAGTAKAMQWAADLAEMLARHAVYMCTDLTLATETIARVSARELRTAPPSGRIIILFVKETL